MRFRRQLHSLTRSNDLPEYYARLLRSGEANARDHKGLIRYLEWLARSDSHSFKKHNKRIQRFDDACAITERLHGLIDGGMSRVEAMDTLAREHGCNSPEALDKWLRRNRRLPELD